jgi:hypothetical protein
MRLRVKRPFGAGAHEAAAARAAAARTAGKAAGRSRELRPPGGLEACAARAAGMIRLTTRGGRRLLEVSGTAFEKSGDLPDFDIPGNVILQRTFRKFTPAASRSCLARPSDARSGSNLPTAASFEGWERRKVGVVNKVDCGRGST